MERLNLRGKGVGEALMMLEEYCNRLREEMEGRDVVGRLRGEMREMWSREEMRLDRLEDRVEGMT